MRITFQGQYRDAAAAINTTASQLLDAQRQVSTGRRINKISDDPTGANVAIAERNALGGVEQYEKTADSVGSRLAVVDTVLADIVDKLTRAQSVALAGQGSTKTAVQREGAAQELRGIRAALLDNLNTTFHGAYIFAGVSSTTRPFTEATPGGTVNTYAGSTTEMEVDIGDGRSAKIGFDGNSIAQGSAGQHVFDVLDDLITAVLAGDDDAITLGRQDLEEAFNRAISAQTVLGNDMQEIDAQKLRLQQMKLAGTERLSKVEDANMAEAITSMAHADQAYQAALAAVNVGTKVSLLDYLK